MRFSLIPNLSIIMNKTLLIAHRGYSQFEKENTLVAFSAAGAIDSFYGIETDVQVTTDNHFISIHDDIILNHQPKYCSFHLSVINVYRYSQRTNFIFSPYR